MKALMMLATFVLFTAEAFPCDTYSLRQILQSGGTVSVDKTCSTYDVMRLAELGKERLRVDLAGFSAYDAHQIGRAGATLIAAAADFSAYDLRQLAQVAKSRLIADLHGCSPYDARNIVAAGASFTLDHSFSVYDARHICQALVSPAEGSVLSSGFSDYDLRQIAESGCSIIENGADGDSGLSFYQAKNILERNGELEVGHQFSSYETILLARAGKERLTVRLQGFSPYDALQIVREGASFYVDSSFSPYEALQICRARVSPARGQAEADGFSDYDLRQLAAAGCEIVR